MGAGTAGLGEEPGSSRPSSFPSLRLTPCHEPPLTGTVAPEATCCWRVFLPPALHSTFHATVQAVFLRASDGYPVSTEGSSNSSAAPLRLCAMGPS